MTSTGSYDVSFPKLGWQNAEWLESNTPKRPTALQKADTIVGGGGGIMSDTSGANPGASYLEIVGRAAMAGRLSGKKIFVTSVGAGPWILERLKMLAFGVVRIAVNRQRNT